MFGIKASCFHRACTLVFETLVQKFGMCEIQGIDFLLPMSDSVLINLDCIACVIKMWTMTYVIMRASQLDLASHTTVKIFKQGN